MVRLWKRINGEPFMINPHLGILGANPKKRRRKSMAKGRGHSSRHMAWVRSFKKNPRRRGRKHSARRRRRNPYPVAGAVINPRRRRPYRSRWTGRYAKKNPHHRRRHRRNPAFLRSLGLGTIPPIQSIFWAGLGVAGTPMAENYLTTNFIPVSITSTTIGKYAVRIGTVLGLSFLVRSLIGRAQANMVAIGGGAYVLLSAVKEFAPPNLLPASFGMSAYKLPGGMGSYNVSAGRNYTALGAPAWGAQNTARFAAGGAGNVVAARFRRFQ